MTIHTNFYMLPPDATFISVENRGNTIVINYSMPPRAFTESMESIQRMKDKIDAARKESDREMEEFYKKYPQHRPKHT